MASKREQKLDESGHPLTSGDQQGEFVSSNADGKPPLEQALETARHFLARQPTRPNGHCEEGPLWILRAFLSEVSGNAQSTEQDFVLGMETRELVKAMYDRNGENLTHPNADAGRKTLDRWFKRWGDLADGLAEAARDCGSDFVPHITREEAGLGRGRNRPNVYRFEAKRTEGKTKLPFPGDGEIKYTGEGRSSSKGWSLIINIIRSRYFLWVAFAAFAVQVVVFGWALMNPVKHYEEFFIGLVTLAMMYYFALPLTQRQQWNVFVAPAIYQPDDGETWLMETDKNAPKHTVQLRRVKYVGQCLTCGARVVVSDGGKRYPDQLVGRCQSYPRDHVYSFNSYSKIGKAITS